jgi:hypothetical protein
MSEQESNPFFDHPILNSPYEIPKRHWELDKDGQPTQQVLETRRRAEFITPVPKPKKRRRRVPISSTWFSTRVRDSHLRNRSTTRPRSSMKSVAT